MGADRLRPLALALLAAGFAAAAPMRVAMAAEPAPALPEFAVGLRCGQRPLAPDFRPIWTALGEFEVQTQAWTILHIHGCDGTFLTFRRPSAAGDQPFAPLEEDRAEVVFATDPHWLIIRRGAGLDTPFTLGPIDHRSLSIQLHASNGGPGFEQVIGVRSDREACHHAAGALRMAQAVIDHPERYIDAYDAMQRRIRDLHGTMEAAKASQAWRDMQAALEAYFWKALQGETRQEERARAERFWDMVDPLAAAGELLAEKTGGRIRPGVVGGLELMGEVLGRFVESSSTALAWSVVTFLAQRQDAALEDLISRKDVTEFVDRWGDSVRGLRETELVFWRAVTFLRQRDCVGRFGPGGTYPSRDRFPAVPHDPLDIPGGLPVGIGDHDLTRTRDVETLLTIAEAVRDGSLRF